MCLGLLTCVLGKHSGENYYDLPKITTLPHLSSLILLERTVSHSRTFTFAVPSTQQGPSIQDPSRGSTQRTQAEVCAVAAAPASQEAGPSSTL